MKNIPIRSFRATIWNYYRCHKRTLPWRKTRDPYRILVSEGMLQQTQVATVVKKYPVFVKKFKSFRELARSPLKEILSAWQGLGYNRRALYLHRLATIVTEKFHGRLPDDRGKLLKLPGIGEGTAGAILAFAFNKPIPFIETNIRRVFIHSFFPKRRRVSDREILPLVEKTLDRKNSREWYYALMDYGAMLKSKAQNPNRRSSAYHRQAKFKGSRRELRGLILKTVLRKLGVTAGELQKLIGKPLGRIRFVLQELEREGFLRRNRGKVTTV